MYRVPKYRHHKARNVAVITLDGKDHFLGSYNRLRCLVRKRRSPRSGSEVVNEWNYLV